MSDKLLVWAISEYNSTPKSPLPGGKSVDSHGGIAISGMALCSHLHRLSPRSQPAPLSDRFFYSKLRFDLHQNAGQTRA